MKILVTGFDPFHHEKINPALEVIKRLPDRISHVDIIKLEVPTIAYQSLKIIEEAIIQYDPDMILSIGQAGGRSDITVERIGINVNDFSIADNAGKQIIDELIFKDGPDAYFVNIPVKAIVKNIQDHHIPASISLSAGTFICNHVTYGVRHLIETKYKGKKSGFIHIPFLPEQVIDKRNMASMSLEMSMKAIEIAILTMIETKDDIKECGGIVC